MLDWKQILDDANENIKVNICVVNGKANIIDNHPNLEKYYEIVYQKMTEVAEQLKDKETTISKKDIDNFYKFAIIKEYLEAMSSEEYLYIYDYNTNQIYCVWTGIGAMNVELAQHEDKIMGMKLYKEAIQKE